MSKDKLDHYEYFLDMLGNPFDIIGLTETWLNSNTVNSPIFKDYNYNHVYETWPLDKKHLNAKMKGVVFHFLLEITLHLNKEMIYQFLPHTWNCFLLKLTYIVRYI